MGFMGHAIYDEDAGRSCTVEEANVEYADVIAEAMRDTVLAKGGEICKRETERNFYTKLSYLSSLLN